jgi:hypothetical protein
MHPHFKPLQPQCSWSLRACKQGPRRNDRKSLKASKPHACVAADGQTASQATKRRILFVTWAVHIKIMHWCKYISHCLHCFVLAKTQQEHWIYPWTVDQPQPCVVAQNSTRLSCATHCGQHTLKYTNFNDSLTVRIYSEATSKFKTIIIGLIWLIQFGGGGKIDHGSDACILHLVKRRFSFRKYLYYLFAPVQRNSQKELFLGRKNIWGAFVPRCPPPRPPSYAYDYNSARI